MNKLEVLTGRNYLSYSSLNSYLDCGERFRLERVANVPQQQAWWSVGGSAFHKASEYIDLGEIDDPIVAWDKAWAEQLAEVEDVGAVRAGGRATKEWPLKENGQWWTANGPRMLGDYQRWTYQMFNLGWQWWNPVGENIAVELPVNFELGDVLIKGYIDRVMVNSSGELVVVDLKTGAHKPASTMQLGVYSVGIQKIFGVKPTLGAYYMARKNELSEMNSLIHYTEELLGSWFSKGKQGIEQELFIPHVTSMCGTCSVAPYCIAVGGVSP